MKFLVLILLAFSLSSCVTTLYGKKKFAPTEAAHRADDTIGDWLGNMGAPQNVSSF